VVSGTVEIVKKSQPDSNNPGYKNSSGAMIMQPGADSAEYLSGMQNIILNLMPVRHKQFLSIYILAVFLITLL
jgi:hypothetical protein